VQLERLFVLGREAKPFINGNNDTKEVEMSGLPSDSE
jgi:hypothetical protein